MHYKVKNMEIFKDGNILNGRQLKPGEILVLDDITVQRIQNSGGTLEVIEKMIPNPLKSTVEKPKEIAEEAVEAPQPVKRKAGRPRKNG